MAAVAPAPSSDTAATPAPFGRKVRVGVFADSRRQPRWLVEAIAKVATSDFAEICFVRTMPRSGPARATPGAWQIYSWLDRKLFGSSDWSRPVDVMALLPPSRRNAPEEAVDVAVVLGDVANESVAQYATHGVWRYCFGDGEHACEPHAGIREVLEATEVTGAGIRVHLPGQGDRIAYQSWSRTLPYSVARNRANLFAKATEFLPRALKQLHATGVVPGTQAPQSLPGTEVQAFVPGTSLIDAPVRMAKRVVTRALEKAMLVEQWSIGFRFVDIEPWTGSMSGFCQLHSPGNGFWADPFPLQAGGKSYIFFEDLPEEKGRAHISVIEVDRQGRASAPTRVLERDYHLSYPFLVEDGGELYMIPETAGNRTVEIYRCVEFPNKWKRERVLIDGIVAADATVHRANGRWWMFANVSANGAEIHDELHVFSSESLLGDWQPLAANPVKSDVRGARPAGRLFTQGGKLYRPAQICAPIYGAGVALQRVTALGLDGYAEQEERRILPSEEEGVLGVHTINRAGDLSVIDAFARRPRL